MTRDQLAAVVYALVEIIDSWNDSAADEDRGRSDDGICLTLWDDGSGNISRRVSGTAEVEDIHDFDNLNDLVDALVYGEGVELDGEPGTLRRSPPSTPPT